jgi:hypothetical protein
MRWLTGLEADDTRTLTWWAIVVGAVMALTAAIAVLVGQVQVTDEQVAVTRVCGSALDGVLDRSGWELWWARDLDEPDADVRSALVRTRRCPAVINRRLAVAAALGGLGLVLSIAAGRSARRTPPRTADSASRSGRLTRLGRATSLAGGALTVAGAVAVLVLVADAESTLFLYTDRLVVAVVGIIVLIPAIALFVLGRMLVIMGDQTGAPDAEASDV